MRIAGSLVVILSGLVLSACGGGSSASSNSGGGGGSTTPPPPPPPPPVSTSPFNTTEFQANWGLDAVNALAAYDAGLTGAGIVVATIDTGIDLDQPDLVANLHPASRDIYDGIGTTISTIAGSTSTFISTRTGGADLDDADGHGTFIAGLIAGEKNGNGAHGLAFNAQVLAVRTDESDSCPADCAFDDNAIAASVNHAMANGADIISISLGGSASNPFLAGALSDAVAAGAIVIISAGNAPEDTPPFGPSPNPDPFALDALQSWAGGQIIIAGAHNSLGTISDFSNRAGTGQQFYLLAPGEDLFSVTVDASTGGPVQGIGSGTSFAAPMIAGAAALLLEQFPALTALEIVDILLTTATDIGAVGVDAINGHGRLNIEAALAPLGVTSLILETQTGSISAGTDDLGLLPGGAFGDGFGQGFSGGAIFLDSYDRAYRTSFESSIQNANPYTDFLERFETSRDFETASLQLTPGSTLTFGSRYKDSLDFYEERVLGLQSNVKEEVTDVRMKLTSRIDDRTELTLGFGGSVDEGFGILGASPFSSDATIFLSDGARPAWTKSYGDGRRMGVSRSYDDGLYVAFAYGRDRIDIPKTYLLPNMGEEATKLTVMGRVGKKYETGTWDLTVGVAQEEGMVLDSYSSGALKLGSGADTTFVSLNGEKALGVVGGKSVFGFGRFAAGRTKVNEVAGSAFSSFEGLGLSQFAVGLWFDEIFAKSGRLNLVVSQPLRVETGGVRLATAMAFDYIDETPLFSKDVAGLAPSGREIDFEIGYRFGLGGTAHLSTNLLYQVEPGHVAGRESAVTLMLTGRSAF
jgi:subtilisin family serine protease